MPAAEAVLLATMCSLLTVLGLRMVTGRLTGAERRWMLEYRPTQMPWFVLSYGLGGLLITLAALIGAGRHAIGDPLVLGGLGLCALGLVLRFWTPRWLVPAWLRTDPAPSVAPRPPEPAPSTPGPAPGVDVQPGTPGDLPIYDVEAAASNIAARLGARGVSVAADRVAEVLDRHFDLTGTDDTPEDPQELERLTTQIAPAIGLDPAIVRQVLEQLDTELRAAGLLYDVPPESTSR